MAKYTQEELIIKEVYEDLVVNKKSPKYIREKLEGYAKRYIEAVLNNSKYAEEKIEVKEVDDPELFGGMDAKNFGEVSKLYMNYETFIKGTKDKTDESGNVVKNKYGENVQEVVFGFGEKDELKRFEAFREFVDTLNHEMEHFFQHKNAIKLNFNLKGIKFVDMLTYIREKVAAEIDSRGFYEKNYGKAYVENDANRIGSLKTTDQLIKILPDMDDDHFNIVLKNVLNTLKNRTDDLNKMKTVIDEDKAIDEDVERADLTSVYTDEYMARHPEVVEKEGFRALLKEYNEDGSRKNFVDVVREKNEIIDKIMDNQRINNESRTEMLEQALVGYGRIMCNAIRRCGKEELRDIQIAMGDERFTNNLDFIYQGLIYERQHKLEELNEFKKFIQDNHEKIEKNGKLKQICSLYEKAVDKIGYITKDKDGYLQINEDTEEMDFIKKRIRAIQANPLAREATKVEKEEAEKRLDLKNQEMRAKDYKRCEEKEKKQKLLDKKEEEEEYQKKLDIYEKKMKDPVNYLKYKITKIFHISPKTLKLPPAPKKPESMSNAAAKRVEIQEKMIEQDSLDNSLIQKYEMLETIKQEATPLLEQARSQKIMQRENLEKDVIENNQNKDIGG